MDNSIGVGAIVGLAFASSIYVWKSESFGVLQKTILYICIIFPPAQWLGILIMLIYNNIKVENSAEKVSERKVEQVKTKLDSSINSLTELRDKGILTDVEYYEKVAKIKTEKAQQEIQNSSQYRQLKSLRDSGILTKEEFENKIKLIKIEEVKTNAEKLIEVNEEDSFTIGDILAYTSASVVIVLIIFYFVSLI